MQQQPPLAYPPHYAPHYAPPPYAPPSYAYRPFRPGLAAKVSQPVRVLIGIGAFLPLVAFAAYFVFIFGFMARAFAATARNPAQPTPFVVEWFAGFGLVMLLFFVGIIVYYALFILFVIDAIKNDQITEDVKIIWMFALFFGSFIALPIYWFLYFRRAPEQPPLLPPPYGVASDQYAPMPPPGAYAQPVSQPAPQIPPQG